MRQSTRAHSLRLLLYLEWLLLGLGVLAIVLPVPFEPALRFSLLGLFCILGLGLLGLRFPAQPLFKVLYTILEFGFILLPGIAGQLNRALPFLLVIVVVRSCQMFGLLGRSIVASLALAAFLFNVNQESYFIDQFLDSVNLDQVANHLRSENTILLLKFNVSISFGLMLIAVMLLVNSLLAEHQSRKQLALAHEQLRQYALRIENQATLQERNRIAREIHDALGHTLTAQSIQLENAIIFCPSEAEKTHAFLLQSKHLCSKALREVRQSVAALRSDALPGQNLEQAIHAAVHEFQQIMPVQSHCSLRLTQILPREVNIVVYRIIQEALMNIYKHSAASEVEVQLEQQHNCLMIIVKDNGEGFDPSQNKTGFGIQGMRERTIALNGKFYLNSQPGQGCEVIAQIPLLQQELK